LRNRQQQLITEEKELTAKLEPIQKDNTKLQKDIPQIEKNNEELQEKILHLEKLNELSMQLKNVNLEELKLLTQSSEQVYHTISDLSRKWVHLKSFIKDLGE